MRCRKYPTTTSGSLRVYVILVFARRSLSVKVSIAGICSFCKKYKDSLKNLVHGNSAWKGQF